MVFRKDIQYWMKITTVRQKQEQGEPIPMKFFIFLSPVAATLELLQDRSKLISKGPAKCWVNYNSSSSRST